MTDITKLADKWRSWDDASTSMNCARELEAALPAWTRISEDESTWPDADGFVMSLCMDEGELPETIRGGFLIHLHKKGEHFWSWRPLCSIDYPEES